MTLGIRCFPDKIAFVVLEGTKQNPKVLESDVRKFPKDLSRAGFLNWASKEVRGILQRRKVKRSGFKEIENTAKLNRALVKRAEVEGVLQAVLYEAGQVEVDGMNKMQIKKSLQFEGNAKEIGLALESTPLQEFLGRDHEDAALVAWSLLN